jgi:hypothetical protein
VVVDVLDDATVFWPPDVQPQTVRRPLLDGWKRAGQVDEVKPVGMLDRALSNAGGKMVVVDDPCRRAADLGCRIDAGQELTDSLELLVRSCLGIGE